MTKQELANEKRLNNAVIESSMTMAAQLKALSHEAGLALKSKDKDGKCTNLQVTKRAQLSKLGLEPKVTARGACLGYTPAMYDAAVDESLKEVGSDGKTRQTKVYVERVVTVTIEDAEVGMKDYSVYTSEEADKVVKGEKGAKACKLYRKVGISWCGWSPALLVKVLWQSRNIDAEKKRAEASEQKWNDQKKGQLYIVKNIGGVLKKIEVQMINE